MDTKDLVIDDGGQGKVVKDLTAIPPYVDRAKLSQTFIVKAVDLGNLP